MPVALIVDDEPLANALLARLVGLRGYQARAAFSGAQALDAARDAPPDVVLLDLMLPDRHGMDVCRDLASDPRTCGLPVIVVSARLADVNRLESLRAGACEFVPKPFTPDQLFASLRAAEAWRTEARGDAGTIPLTAPDEHFRRALGLLRHRLAGRPSGCHAVSLVESALESARDAARGAGEAPDATADYRIADGRITVWLRDGPAWPGSREWESWSREFDEVEPDDGGHCARLTKALTDIDGTGEH
jgi:CheY-like chemotaxis protein